MCKLMDILFGKKEDGNQTTVTTVKPTNRYAILAGSNFVGTPNELQGCINDIIDVRALIEPSGIKIVADLRDHDMTTSNWKAAMTEVASLAKDGDVIFHSHSHHGAQIQDTSEEDGLAEVFCQMISIGVPNTW